jgi:4-hydroxy-2-oxoheptanedioate aldolase
MAEAGFDWLFIDTEHSPVDQASLAPMLQAIDLLGTPTIVRVAWNRPELIGWALDIGADGVMVPMINTAEQAREAVRACRYPPVGHRSWGPIRSGLGRPSYTPAAGNDAAVCVILIETQEAIANLDAILSVEGIDVVALGQSDLGISHGMHPAAGRTDPRHQALVEKVLDSCTRRGLPAWINCTDRASAERWHRKGFRMISLDNDVTYLAKTAKATCADLKGLVAAGANGAPGP